MHKMLALTAALLAAILVGCRASSPEMAKDADDVYVSIDEADRAFLYSHVDAQRLVEMTRPGGRQAEPAHLYKYRPDTHDLQEISSADLPHAALGDNGLISVSVGGHGATVNLWNWIRKDVTHLSLRLDGLSARPVKLPDQEGEAYDVVFAAKEASVFPGVRDEDHEIFKARLHTQANGGTTVLSFQQLTHNNWNDLQPSFSPDGHWIVFVTDQLGPKNVALMDANGDFVRLLTNTDKRNSYFPAVLPNNEECLYASDANGLSSFFICGLDGKGHRRASGQELKQMLFSWDDGTRHTYLLTEIFAHEKGLRLLLGLPQTLNLLDLVLLGEWNSPTLKQYRETIQAARAEKDRDRKARGAVVSVRDLYMADVGVLVDEPRFLSPGDRAIEGLNRLLFTLSFPLFQGSLDKAISQRDMWQEIVYSQSYVKSYNNLVCGIATAYADYSEQMARAQVLRRIQDLNQKRKFLWEARGAAGKELPDKPIEADSFISATEAELTATLGKARDARVRLCAAVGLGNMEPIDIQTEALNWEQPPLAPPPLQELQALAQVNHPDLARLKFLELRAAAIRDMGAPETRSRPTVDLTYGYGTDHIFDGVVDDFIALGIGHSLPLATLGIDRSYKEQWTHEVLAYQHEREQARLNVDADLQQSYSALQSVLDEFKAAKDALGVAAEKVRLSRIYGAKRVMPEAKQHDIMEQTEAQIAGLNQQMVLILLRAEFYRTFAKCYCNAGLARNLMDVLAEKPGARMAQRRSVWLWRSLEVAMDPQMREQFLRVCAEQGINRVYCFVGQVENEYYLQKHNWEFGYLLDLCRQRGVEVYALVGDPHWVEGTSQAQTGDLIAGIMQFNARTQEGKAGFAGVKIDVEPHALPAWNTPDGRAQLIKAYLSTIDYIKAVSRQGNSSIPITLDVPYTYGDIAVPDGGKNLFETLCDRADGLTLMAYLNSADRITEKALPLLEVAQQHGTSLEIGVETGRGQPEGTSFAEQPIEDMVIVLNTLYERFMGFRSFAGFAIHDYNGLAQLIEKSHGHQVQAH